MSEIIKPTRSELLKTRKRAKLARKGHELLKKKQDALLIEFFALLKEVAHEREALERVYGSAVRRANEARALESDLRLKAAALSASQRAPIALDIQNIAGVKIPRITQVASEHNAPIYDTLILQDVGTAYQHVVESVLKLAAKETALRKLLVEIKKTKRRAHALEHLLIPRLQYAVKHIQGELEERAREEFSRLKRRKSA